MNNENDSQVSITQKVVDLNKSRESSKLYAKYLIYNVKVISEGLRN